VYRSTFVAQSLSSASSIARPVYRSGFSATSVSAATVRSEYLFRPAPSMVSGSKASTNVEIEGQKYRVAFVANSGSSASITVRYFQTLGGGNIAPVETVTLPGTPTQTVTVSSATPVIVTGTPIRTIAVSNVTPFKVIVSNKPKIISWPY
jgi:hypothetical protein